MLEATTEMLSYEELLVENMQLRHELDQLKKLVFGSKHERFIASQPAEQLSLDMGIESKESPVIVTQHIEYTRNKVQENKKASTGRMLLPASLPREQVVIEPDEDVSGYKKIGEEITEELEQIPSKLFVRQYIRPKYARPHGEGIVIGTLPSRPIEKGIAGPGLLAQVVIDKYTDHLPIHRQMERFKRSGINLPYSTLTDWIGSVCKLLEPLYEVHREMVLSSDYICADETPIKVLDKEKKGKTHQGYHWVYHAPEEKLVLFDYREGRGREGPKELLKNFKGYLQTDGYEVYDYFSTREDIIHLHCMAHARRKFDEALSNDKARAEYALTQFQNLYAIERKAKEDRLSKEQIEIIRQKEAAPILDNFKDWMMDNYRQLTPKSPIGQAISYALQRWDKLCIYINDGRLRIDNNLVENAIRPLTVGRKNYLFAGSHNGARRAAMLYSFTGTCKMNNINVFDWLKDILTRIPEHPVNQIKQLLPINWTTPENQK
jgi:transposase